MLIAENLLHAAAVFAGDPIGPRRDALVGYRAGAVSAWRIGVGQGRRLELLCPLWPVTA
jgi:hypothetical protein